MNTAMLEANRQVVLRQAQAINDRDLDAVAATIADDFVRHCQATPDLDIRSREEFISFLEADFKVFPDSVLTADRIVAEGDLVAIFGTYEGTQQGAFGPFPASGKKMKLDFATFFRVESGRICEIWATWDNLAGLAQLGHFPPPGEGGRT